MVEYLSKEVILSRKYPFGSSQEVGKGEDKKEVTVVTVNELNGVDDEQINKQVEKGAMGGYAQIAVSCGLTYEESLKLANKDSKAILEAIEGL